MDLPKFVPKGWGYESIIVNKPEYCGKLLFFKKGRRCSMHYHLKKDETFFCHTGKLAIIHSMEDCLYEGKINVRSFPLPEWASRESHWLDFVERRGDIASMTILEPGDIFHVPIGLRHSMLGLLDTLLIEFSTEHFDSDSIRVLHGD